MDNMQKRLLPGFILILLCATGGRLQGQMPSCGQDNQLIYEINSGIYNFNPFLPLSATNPVLNAISIPSGTENGLAVSENINDPLAPSPTFYIVKDQKYHYYDGAAWVNTGHNASSVNPCGAGPYIYNLSGGDVYKYDGSGDDMLVFTLPGYNPMFGPVADLAGDCEGNFYMLKCTNPDSWLRKYDPQGNVLQEWVISNPPNPNIGGGGGFAIIGSTLFVQDLVGTYSGLIGSESISLAPFANGVNALDMGCCPSGVLLSAVSDTVYACSSGGVLLTAQANPPYSYSLLSGSASITQNGSEFNVVPATLSTLVLQAIVHSPCSGDYPHTDTYYVVPAPLINAGFSETLYGCGTWLDTLHGSVSNTMPWVNYHINWEPSGFVSLAGNTLSPIIVPTTNATYVMEVSTESGQGNCLLRDSVQISLIDASVTADFSFDILQACTQDTVMFTNLSANQNTVFWDFGDGDVDTALSPVHIYQEQDAFPVRLMARNEYCADSLARIVDTRHPLIAGFTVSEDSVCQADEVLLHMNDTSIGAVSYFWDFGDGNNTDLISPSHIFNLAGMHRVMQVVSDQIPCFDTAYRNVYVDSIPFLHLYADQQELCVGDALRIEPDYLQTALSVSWDLGDAVLWDQEGSTAHSYDEAGSYTVSVAARYPVCPDAIDTLNIQVYPLPQVNLGADTSLCLDGHTVVLHNLSSAPNEPYHYLWNTGDTTVSLRVLQPGKYSLRISTEPLGCNTTDEIIVDKDCYTDIPNAFTPNSDGDNDYFFPRTLLSKSISNFKMQVFNRWGQLVFETNRTDGSGWDGRFNDKEQPVGVYIYVIAVAYRNDRQEQYQGNVTLIR